MSVKWEGADFYILIHPSAGSFALYMEWENMKQNDTIQNNFEHTFSSRIK